MIEVERGGKESHELQFELETCVAGVERFAGVWSEGGRRRGGCLGHGRICHDLKVGIGLDG